MNQKLPPRIRRYLERESTWCKPSTIAGYRVALAHFCDSLEQTFPLKKISRKQISQLNRIHFQNYLADLNQKKLVPYSRVNYLLSVKKYLQWEAEQGALKEDVLEILDRKYLPKVPEYLPRPLSSETDHLLQERLRHSQDPYAPLFLLLRLTGLRISELILLPTDCLLTTARGEKYLKVPLGKMNNERLIPLSDYSLKLIARIKAADPLRKKNYAPARLIGLPGSVAHVYAHLNGKFRKLTHDLNDQNRPVTFHRLRHSFATSLLSGGVGLVSLMKLLGHRRIEMTLRYTKVTPSHLRNEYLKAIQVIEKQNSLPKIHSPDPTKGPASHSEILFQLSCFIHKMTTPSPLQKKNLLLRISRLKRDITNSQRISP